MPKPQTLKNHTKVDVLHHLILVPLFLANFGFSFILYRNHHLQHPNVAAWWIVLSAGLLLLTMKIRMYALQNQDRLIRLEQNLRLAALLPVSDKALVGKLTKRQLIALRFASDEELPGLARRTADENLGSKEIKQAIVNWRADYDRV